MNTMKNVRYPFRTLILLASLCILMLSSVFPVYADPTENELSSGAWVEVVCTTVPEDFEGSVSIVISDFQTNESYTVDCLKANGFIGRKKLPYGKYFVDWIYTSDTFYYEGFTDLYSFELTKEMSAAKKIEIEVIKNNVPDDVFTMTPGSPSNEDTFDDTLTDENIDSEKETVEKAPEISSMVDKAEPEQGTDTSTNSGDLEEGEASSGEPLTTKSVLRDIGISLLVTIVFVAVVASIVYFIRSKYFDEE